MTLGKTELAKNSMMSSNILEHQSQSATLYAGGESNEQCIIRVNI